MRVELQFDDDVAIVRLSGKFIAGSDAPFLRQKVSGLIEAGSRKLIIDLADVPYIDSTGIGFLVASRELAGQAGASVLLAGVNQHVKKVLDEVKLSQFFVIAKDRASAIRRLKEGTAPPGISEATLSESKARKKGSKSPD